jgi:hypothetical protein
MYLKKQHFDSFLADCKFTRLSQNACKLENDKFYKIVYINTVVYSFNKKTNKATLNTN